MAAAPSPSVAAPGLLGMLLGSLCLHAALLGGVLQLARLWPGLRPPPRQVVMAKLVRLGTPRPKDMLPHLDAPAPPRAAAVSPPVAPAAAPAAPTPNPRAATVAPPRAARAAPGAHDRARALSRMRRALERIRQQTDGQADGDAAGDAAEAVLGERFSAEIDACLHAHYVIEGYAAERVAGLRAQVVLRIGSSGKIVEGRLENSSGLAAFDQAVLRAVSRCGKLSPPPTHLRAVLAREGIEITFTP